MKFLSKQAQIRLGTLLLGLSVVTAALGLYLRTETTTALVYVLGLTFVFGVFGLFLLVRPFVPVKVAYIGALISYLMLVGAAMIGVNNREFVDEWMNQFIFGTLVLAGTCKLFLLLAVSHAVGKFSKSED